MRIKILMVLILAPLFCISQGYNSSWLLGYYPYNYQKARINFDATSYNLSFEYRKMTFQGTEATICDQNGNLLLSSNGVWIANSINDTLLNGNGLNPGTNVSGHPDGLLDISANIILPYPGDSLKMILFHHTDEWDGISYPAFQVYYTVIDMSLDSGRGGVITKNNIAFTDTLNWGLAACRHANGRDWWIVAQKLNSDLIYSILLTNNGIYSISSQHLNIPAVPYNVTQPIFSNDGTLFSFSYSDGGTVVDHKLYLFDFDRCSGIFSNTRIVNLEDGNIGIGLAFSPSGTYIYSCSTTNIFQINVSNLFVDTVANYDGFSSPFPPFYTTFLCMYLAANGKIYMTSGNSTSYFHFIDFPDSAGISCDVQQHGLYIDSVRHFRAVPNHPNYYLGPLVGSICDSLTGMDNHLNEIKNFSIKPNPNNGNFNISYLLPQNKVGWFEVYDLMGKEVFKTTLPPWSTLQNIHLPSLSSGIYNAVIKSGYDWDCKKIVIIQD